MDNKVRNLFMLLFHGLIFALTLGFDQISKFFLFNFLEKNGGLKILPFLDLQLEFNTGCAFSLFDGCSGNAGQLVLILVSSLVILCFLVFALKRIFSGRLALPETLIISGGLGNILDRLFSGAVIDFIYLHAWNYHWPTFNFADCMVFIGILFLAKRTLK